MSKRTLWIIVGVLVLLLVGCGVCFVTGVGGVLLATREPEQVALEVQAPTHGQVGEDIVVNIVIHNQANRSRVLDSIDLDDSLLNGLKVMETRPRTTDIVPGAGFTSYYFEAPIPPAGSLPVRLVLRAQQPGLYQGDVDVCIDSAVRCTTYTLNIQIAP